MVFVNDTYALSQHLLPFTLWDEGMDGEQMLWVNNTEISSIKEYTLPRRRGLEEERQPVSLISMKNGQDHLVRGHAIERLREVIKGRED